MWVTSGGIGRETLRTNTDAAIITQQYERIVNPPPRLDKRPYLQDHDQSDNDRAIRKRLAAA